MDDTDMQSQNKNPILHVVVATPLGKGGKGGIDRIMDEVRIALANDDATPDMCVRFIVTRGQRNAAYSLLQLPVAIAKLASLRALNRANLVHINLSSHGSTERKMLLAAACRSLRIPYIVHLHGSRMRQYWLQAGPRLKRRIDTMFIGASRIIVLGDVWRQFVASQVPDAEERILILPNATKAAQVPRVADQSRVRILFLGRLGDRKGVPQLVDALGTIASDPRWHAIIAGDGDVDAVRAQARRAGIESRVDLPGWCGPKKVEQLLAHADILVLPSFDENLPMSVIEGMAAGLAVIATPVGATEEIIRHEMTGLLVQPGDVPGLSEAIKRLVDSAELRATLGANAASFHAKHLEITPYTKRLQSIWHAAVRA